MPPRRPGGKYKGKCGRAKGEATIEKELLEKARNALVERTQRLNEERQAKLMAGQTFGSPKEQEKNARKQKILNLLMGSKGPKKWFQSWKVGVANVRHERLLRLREFGWTRSCGQMDHTVGSQMGCTSYSLLREPALEAMRQEFCRQVGCNKTGMSDTSISVGDRTFDSRSSQWKIGSHTSSMAKRRVSMAQKLPSMDNNRSSSLPALANGEEFVRHHATGRRCVLNNDAMRVTFASDTPWVVPRHGKLLSVIPDEKVSVMPDEKLISVDKCLSNQLMFRGFSDFGKSAEGESLF